MDGRIKPTAVRLIDAGCPLYFGFTPARISDITAAKEVPIEAGATYVFDLGYYDYAWWAKLDAASCRILTTNRTAVGQARQ